MEIPRMGFLCNLGRKLDIDLSRRGNVPSSVSCCPPFHGSPGASITAHIRAHFCCPASYRPQEHIPQSSFAHFSCLIAEPRSTGGGWAQRV